jgi:hypothetical protein
MTYLRPRRRAFPRLRIILGARVPTVGGVLALALVSTAIGLTAGAAFGRDSEAPAGAGHRWLPCEPWVMFHWLPYDERALYARLDVSRDVVLRWIRNDRHRTLAGLARRRGKDPERIADALSRRWRGHVSKEHYAELRARTLRTLTQGHLAQHVLFHRFHQPGIAARGSQAFGPRALDSPHAQLRGFSPAQIGRRHGRSRRAVAIRVMAVLRHYANRGVRESHTTRAQATRFLRFQRRGLSHWLDKGIRKPPIKRRGRPRRTLRPRSRLLCRLLTGRIE